MKHYHRFIKIISLIIFNYGAEPGLDSKTISEIILKFLSKENTSREDEQEFSRFLEEKKIKHLVHFTHVDNIENILKFGLIPRIFLQEKFINLALKPVFSDDQRHDGREEVNFLSVSFPNYKMFFTKRKRKPNPDEWAVILFDLNVIRKHVCEFSASNSSSLDSESIEGIEGIKKMFFNSQLREQLRLPDHYTTDPQAEVLESSVIPPSWIKEIHLKSENSKNKLIELIESENIKILVNNQFFSARKDYKYWQKTGVLESI